MTVSRPGRLRGNVESMAESADLSAAIILIFGYQRKTQSDRARSAADHAEVFD